MRFLGPGPDNTPYHVWRVGSAKNEQFGSDKMDVLEWASGPQYAWLFALTLFSFSFSCLRVVDAIGKSHALTPSLSSVPVDKTTLF